MNIRFMFNVIKVEKLRTRWVPSKTNTIQYTM